MKLLLKESLLWRILQTESESGNSIEMEQLIITHCKKMGYHVRQDKDGNIYAIKGDEATYPCVVAHLDTVHAIHGDGITIVKIGDNVTGMNPVTMEQTGIGGDDKCGIFVALNAMNELPACKAAFFRDEEIGCIGSGKADLEFFKDCRFVLQADRRGNSDFVTDICGPLSSKSFQSDVSPILRAHGYKPCSGAMTDVQELRDNNVGVSCANMSAGYYNPHRSCEFINLKDLDNVAEMVVAICRLKKTYKFKHERPKRIKWPTFPIGDAGIPPWTPKTSYLEDGWEHSSLNQMEQEAAEEEAYHNWIMK